MAVRREVQIQGFGPNGLPVDVAVGPTGRLQVDAGGGGGGGGSGPGGGYSYARPASDTENIPVPTAEGERWYQTDTGAILVANNALAWVPDLSQFPPIETTFTRNVSAVDASATVAGTETIAGVVFTIAITYNINGEILTYSRIRAV